jgi:hypothetical protein
MNDTAKYNTHDQKYIYKVQVGGRVQYKNNNNNNKNA